MLAVMKRELYSYFHSPIAYIVIAVFYFIANLFFMIYCLFSDSNDFTYVFSSLTNWIVLLVLSPLLTMKIWSEEKKQKTEQLLFTAPRSLSSIVLGKYLAVVVIYLLCLFMLAVQVGITCFFARPDFASILGSLLGIILYGMALFAIGMFISALTESQIIAFIGTLAINFFIMITDTLANMFMGTWAADVFEALSFSHHYKNFTMGILNITDLVFFLTVCCLFVFLNIRVFEKRRWS